MNNLKRLLMLLPRYEAKDVAKEVVKQGRKASPLVGIWRETCSGVDPVVRWADIERACAEARPSTKRQDVRDALAYCFGDATFDKSTWHIVAQAFDTAWPDETPTGASTSVRPRELHLHVAADAVSALGAAHRQSEVAPPPRVEALAPSDDLFDRLEEYLDNHSDVNDGDSRPVANTAMSLLDDLQRWRKKRV